MAQLGTFKKMDDGGFEGEIATLTVKAAKVAIRKVEKRGDGPDFRVSSGKAEIGAAWSGESKDGRPYLTVKLDDPSFAAPAYCRLVEGEQECALIWSRPQARKNGGEE